MINISMNAEATGNVTGVIWKRTETKEWMNIERIFENPSKRRRVLMSERITSTDPPIVKMGTIVAKARKGDDLTEYGIIGGRCPFCNKEMDIKNPFNQRWPPVKIFYLQCSKYNVDYRVRITPSKITVVGIDGDNEI